LSPVCTKERVLMLPSHDVGDVLVVAVIARVLVSPTSQMSVTRKNGRRSLFILEKLKPARLLLGSTVELRDLWRWRVIASRHRSAVRLNHIGAGV
jgi:hypothetical protein